MKTEEEKLIFIDFHYFFHYFMKAVAQYKILPISTKLYKYARTFS